MASTRLSDIDEIEFEELTDTSGVSILTLRARKLGAISGKSAQETALGKGFDVDNHGGLAQTILDD